MSNSIIVAGNGVSLRKMSRSFLESRPLFGMNYLPYYTSLKINFWTSWDTLCIEDNLPILGDKVEAILPTKNKGWMIKNGLLRGDVHNNISFWDNLNPISGLGGSDGKVYYASSLPWAISVAFFLLGFTEFLVVGFDCTAGDGGYRGRGKGAGAHFYDPEGGGGIKRYAASWDKQMYNLRQHLWPLGGTIVNLSPGSQSKLLPFEDWRKYVEV